VSRHLGPHHPVVGPRCPALALVGPRWPLRACVGLRWLLWALVGLRWPSAAAAEVVVRR
jgi:hypothetical protein